MPTASCVQAVQDPAGEVSLKYVPDELRDRRAKRRSGVIVELMIEDPHCRECGLDLASLGVRRHLLSQACFDAARWAQGLGFAKEVCQRVFSAPALALIDMGFVKPRGSLAELDHVKPLWRGGLDHRSNLQVLCQPCHRRKTKREAKLRKWSKRAYKRSCERRSQS